MRVEKYPGGTDRQRQVNCLNLIFFFFQDCTAQLEYAGNTPELTRWHSLCVFVFFCYPFSYTGAVSYVHASFHLCQSTCSQDCFFKECIYKHSLTSFKEKDLFMFPKRFE